MIRCHQLMWCGNSTLQNEGLVWMAVVLVLLEATQRSFSLLVWHWWEFWESDGHSRNQVWRTDEIFWKQHTVPRAWKRKKHTMTSIHQCCNTIQTGNQGPIKFVVTIRLQSNRLHLIALWCDCPQTCTTCSFFSRALIGLFHTISLIGSKTQKCILTLAQNWWNNTSMGLREWIEMSFDSCNAWAWLWCSFDKRWRTFQCSLVHRHSKGKTFAFTCFPFCRNFEITCCSQWTFFHWKDCAWEKLNTSFWWCLPHMCFCGEDPNWRDRIDASLKMLRIPRTWWPCATLLGLESCPWFSMKTTCFHVTSLLGARNKPPRFATSGSTRHIHCAERLLDIKFRHIWNLCLMPLTSS